MKKTIFLFIAIFFSSLVIAQRYTDGRAYIDFHMRLEKDIFGNFKYRGDRGFIATLSKNVFDDITYEDSNNNKLVYKNKFLIKMDNGNMSIFQDLIRYFSNKKDLKEEFEIDVFDKLKYKNSKNFKASLSKNIFDDVEYEDSNGNKIVYKQKFITLFRLTEMRNLDAYLFLDMVYTLLNEKNFKEEYEVDIFDNVVYTSSDGEKMKMDKEMALRYYKLKQRTRGASYWGNLF